MPDKIPADRELVIPSYQLITHDICWAKKDYPLVTESQAQHEHISSLHRCGARKAELLVVACREDCGISHRIHRMNLISRRASFFDRILL